MRVVYLAGAIDSAVVSDFATKEAVRLALTRRGVTVFDPSTAWHNGHSDVGTAINAVNDAAINACDGVLALFSSSRTVGTPMEVQYALDRGIPVAILHAAADRHVALRRVPDAFFTDPQGIKQAALWAVNLPARTQPNAAVTALIERDRMYAEGLPLPAQAKAGDIGCDLTVSRNLTVEPHKWSAVPNDVSVLAPPNCWFLIMGRSSALTKRDLFVMPSVIDGGYTGRLYAMALNLSDEPCDIARGERIAQLLPLPLTRVVFSEVDKLPNTDRGQAGFGSTGA